MKKAGDGNRTHVSSLEGWCSTIELHPHDDNYSFCSSRTNCSISPAGAIVNSFIKFYLITTFFTLLNLL